METHERFCSIQIGKDGLPEVVPNDPKIMVTVRLPLSGDENDIVIRENPFFKSRESDA